MTSGSGAGAQDGVSLATARGPVGLRLYAVGDVHGCAGLLAQLHELIAADLAADPPDDWRIIYLGDFVDRGPDTRGVLAQLVARQGDPRHIFLRGNHDEALLRLLRHGELDHVFALHGGAQTAGSYGVEADVLLAMQDADARRALQADLLAAMPEMHVTLLDQLQLSAQFGDYFFCHAGVRPQTPLDRQDPHDLIWIREPFLSWQGLLEKVVVHGHTPRREPVLLPHRIGVDTAATNTGRLTALVVEGEEQRFLFATE